MAPTVFEICAGGGGQALGLERAGFDSAGAAEIDPHACATLRLNRPEWNVLESDVRELSGSEFRGVDLFAGGVPCPPFSIAGKQLGSDDERDLFPEALRLIREIKPRAVMLENVPGFASEKFSEYRKGLFAKLRRLGYEPDFRILNASGFGIPQLRPRCVVIALQADDFESFQWPEGDASSSGTVGDLLQDLMGARKWPGTAAWVLKAAGIGPTVVGGSKKHGGPDLGPTRAREQWARLGVDGIGIANDAPDSEFPADANPKLTVRMVARLQGFSDDWKFAGKKTAAYRQVGNAFPPPVAAAVGSAIVSAFAREYPLRHDAGQFRIFDGAEEVAG
jgi:DNA (cytosine-5)-methyltransferase 1